jgi:hypothetical protein
MQQAFITQRCKAVVRILRYGYSLSGVGRKDEAWPVRGFRTSIPGSSSSVKQHTHLVRLL